MQTMITHFSKFTQWLADSFVFVVIFIIGATFIIINVVAAPAEGAPTVSNLGSVEFVAGGHTANTQPTLTFDATGADPLDEMAYEIGIFSDADFLVPVLEFTSNNLPAETTSFSYQVGQSGGTYTTGEEAMILSEGSYYWRVLGIALHEVSSERGPVISRLPSAYAFANNQDVAFIVDLTGPLITTVAADVSSDSTRGIGTDYTIAITWVTRGESGSSTVEYGMTDAYGETADGDAGFTHGVSVTCNTEDAPTLSFACTEDATIHYRVISTDNAGNESVSEDYTFDLTSSGRGNSAPVISALGPDASISRITYTSSDELTFSITATDPDADDQLQYHIQIDDSEDFSSPVVDYTSALGLVEGGIIVVPVEIIPVEVVPGEVLSQEVQRGLFKGVIKKASAAPLGTTIEELFRIGQDDAVSGGSYTEGEVGQVLSRGSYYWRVEVIDAASATSGFSNASESFAFAISGAAASSEARGGHGRIEAIKTVTKLTKTEELTETENVVEQIIASIANLAPEDIERNNGAVILGNTNAEPAKVVFSQDLKKGKFNNEVKVLQQYLNQHGYVISESGRGSPGNETKYFGRKTQAALAKFQLEVIKNKSGIIPVEPIGQFGLTTRTYINIVK